MGDLIGGDLTWIRRQALVNQVQVLLDRKARESLRAGAQHERSSDARVGSAQVRCLDDGSRAADHEPLEHPLVRMAVFDYATDRGK